MLDFTNKISITKKKQTNEAVHVKTRLREMGHSVRRNRIPNEHCKRIVRTFQDPHEDYLLVADMLGVNRSTARGILATYVREGRAHERRRGGRNNVT